MKHIFFITLILLSIDAFCQGYTYFEPSPALEKEKRDKEYFFKKRKDDAFTRLQNCTKQCGSYAADANNPKDPCSLPGATPACICACNRKYDDSIRVITQQKNSWQLDFTRREQQYENQQKQASNNKTQSNNNVFGSTNQNSTTNRNNPINESQTNLQKTQQSINNSIDDITNSVVADMNKKHEEEIRKINEQAAQSNEDNKVRQIISIEELSDNNSNTTANDSYSQINSFSDVALFIINHHEDNDTYWDRNKSSCSDEGILNLVLRYSDLDLKNRHAELTINLKKISTSSFDIRVYNKYMVLHFNGESGFAEVRQFSNGTLINKRPMALNGNEGFINLSKNLLNEENQYLLRKFVEQLQKLINGESTENTILRTIYPSDLSSISNNKSINAQEANISELVQFIINNGNYHPIKTHYFDDFTAAYLILADKEGDYSNKSTYILNRIRLDKIDTSSFVVKETNDDIQLQFISTNGNIYQSEQYKYNAALDKASDGTLPWDILTLKNSNIGIIKLSKSLLYKDQQPLLKDFIEKLKQFISTY